MVIVASGPAIQRVLRPRAEDDAQVDQEIYDECDRNPHELCCKWWQPHREHSRKRDTDIGREADKRGSHELQKAVESCLTIEHKPTGQIIVDKSCDAEA
jgi:hypothetical protein